MTAPLLALRPDVLAEDRCVMITNPNPRYWRSTISHYIVNFEKVATIYLARPGDGEHPPPVPADTILQGAVVTACIMVDARANALLLHTTPADFRQLMDAYEQWLSER